MPPWLPTVISSFALAMASGLIVWVRSIEKENQRFREEPFYDRRVAVIGKNVVEHRTKPRRSPAGMPRRYGDS